MSTDSSTRVSTASSGSKMPKQASAVYHGIPLSPLTLSGPGSQRKSICELIVKSSVRSSTTAAGILPKLKEDGAVGSYR